ncbi:hypothetical protein, conserved [Eimeria maxima]|uniref:Uncharacterized protein n=1 Tax=Eimeria maxima TaxID=5804 RepID=U6M3H8_EIMMA|nr:hypothetical protein, conserved [Eimeria maxima]CDJ58546.1 hypothetical protein, conserved [Eimeria maxima]
MARLPIRVLSVLNGPISIKNISEQAGVYVHLNKRMHAIKEQLFGYAKGKTGEISWLKPLKGKELLNYYWPSKYDLPDFQMEQYLQMQALRYAPKKTHPSLTSLAGLIHLLIKKKKIIQTLMQQLDKPLIHENPTLQDLLALYRSLFSDDPLKKIYPEEKSWRWTDNMKPETLLSLLELSAKRRGKVDEEFNSILQQANNCS